MLQHDGALRADLQQYYGIDLDRARSGEHTATHIAALVANLPREARIVAIGNKDAVWGLRETLFAILINNFNLFVWGMADKKKRGAKPELIGPEYLIKPKKKLAARVLPIDELMKILSMPRR